MAYGSGLSAQLGIAQEVTPGTPVSPTRFFPFTAETLAAKKKIVQMQTLGGGQPFDRGAYRVTTQRDAGGDITMPFPIKGAGLLLQNMLGSFATTAVQQATSTAYLQVHTPGAFVGKALSIQKGVPRTDGTVEPFTYTGAKVTGWELDCKQSDLLTLKITVDAMDELTLGTTPASPALATPSYTNAPAFNFVQGQLLSGGTVTTTGGIASIAGATPVAGVRAINLKGSTPLDTARYNIGSVTKAEPLQNGWSSVTGQADFEFGSRALYDQYRSDQSAAMRLTFTGPIIASTYPFLLDILLPQTWIEDGITPQVSGPGLVVPSAPLTATYDGTNPAIQISYQSSDTAV